MSEAKAPVVQNVAPEYLVAGRSVTLEIQLRGGDELRGLQCDGLEGLTVSNINELPTNQNQKQANVRKWSADVALPKAAPLGGRSCVVETPLGKSAAQKIQVLDHAPHIVSLRVLKATSLNGEFEYEAVVADPAGDMAAGGLASCVILTETGDFFGLSSGWIDAVKPAGKGQYLARSSGRLVAPHERSQDFFGVFRLECRVGDKGATTSNRASAPLDFGSRK